MSITEVFTILISVAGGIGINIFYLGKKIEKIDRLESDVKELKESCKHNNDTLITLQTKADIFFPERSPYAEKKSPLRLTGKGKEVSELIGAYNLIQKHEKTLLSFVDQTKTKNSYDAQQEAFRVIAKNFYTILKEEEMNLLKDNAYKIGDALESIVVIFQIIFRDTILKKYDLLVDDLDK